MARSAIVRDRIVLVVKDMARIFVVKHVARSAAALSYYLTISVFPFLICVSAILGSMRIQQTDLIAFLEEIIPVETFTAVNGFLSHISMYSPRLMLGIGIIALLTSSSAGFRSFSGIIGEIQGKSRFHGAWGAIFSFVSSIGFIVAIYVSGLVIISGEWLMQILRTYVGDSGIFELWTWVRFVILFILLFLVIYVIYLMSAPKETKRTHRLPGAISAAVVLVAASLIYSRMITASIKYAVLYGSLASFIILMIWLYTCGIILVMGNVFNISLRRVKEAGRENSEKGTVSD